MLFAILDTTLIHIWIVAYNEYKLAAFEHKIIIIVNNRSTYKQKLNKQKV